MTEYNNKAQRRALELLTILAGHEIDGLAPGDLAKAAEATPSTITRDLRVLADAGFVEQITETKRWRLAPRLVQIALAHMAGIERVKQRVGEVQQRYSRDPR